MAEAHTFPRLLKRTNDAADLGHFTGTSTGATQFWDIHVEPLTDGTAAIVTIYGQLDTSNPITTREIIKEGKNQGKKNATSPLQQAIAEATSKHEKQLTRRDYGLTLEASVAARAASPMLAKVYEEQKKKVDWDHAFGQPKLDGFRCLARRNGDQITFESREGKPINSLPHLVEPLLQALPDGETFDGELYLPGTPFQRLSSWIKRLQPDSAKLQYHIYDLVETDIPFANRTEVVREALGPDGFDGLVPVKTLQMLSEDQLMQFQRDCIEEGFEGAMLRYGNSGYESGKRSASLLKVKTFFDVDYRIVGASEGRGTHVGMAIFTCEVRQGDGVTFDVLAPGTHAQKREAWENRAAWIGKMLTVKMQELTTSENPVPRFPVALRLAAK